MSSDINIAIGADASSLKKVLSDSAKAGESFSGQMKGAFGQFGVQVNQSFGKVGQVTTHVVSEMRNKMVTFQAAITSVIGSAQLIGSAFTAIKSPIEAAANRQTLETAFIPILGSLSLAKQRMAELSDFAASTPFRLPAISKASLILQTLTKGALATGEGLRLVGDAAAATNTPIDELAVTIGRVYDGMVSGRPAGEALMRMQELGLLSGDVRGKLESLQKSGQKGAGVWKLVADELSRFGGGMALQAQTYNGLISTMTDGWSRLLATIGQPIIDSMIPLMKQVMAKMEEMKGISSTLGSTIGAVFNKVGPIILSVAGALGQVVTGSTALGVAVRDIAAAWLLWKVGATDALRSVGVAILGVKSKISAVFAEELALAGGNMRVLDATVRTSCRGMVTAFAAIKVAIKSAFVSTIVGGLVLVVGELIAKVYSLIDASSEATKKSEEIGKDGDMGRGRLKKRANNVKNWDDYDSFVEDIDAEEERLGQARYESEDAGERSKYSLEIKMLNNLREELEETAEARAREGEAVASAQRAKESNAKFLKENAERMQKNREELESLEREHSEKLESIEMSKLDTDGKLNMLIGDRGWESKDAIIREAEDLKAAISGGESSHEAMRAFENNGESVMNRYKGLLELLEKIEEVESQRKEVNNNSKSTIDAYNAEMSMLKAREEKDKDRIRLFEKMARMKELENQFIKEGIGMNEAKNMATNQTNAEFAVKDAEASQEKTDRREWSVTADSLTKIGGGGGSFAVGIPQLSESRKQTGFLKQIVENTKKINSSQVAVLS